MKLYILDSTTKRRNSTYQPVYTGKDTDGWVSVFDNIKFRTPTNMHAPAFIVRPLDGYSVSGNYAVFVDDKSVDHYLWIDDIIANTDGTWTVICSVDVLAEYKRDILTSKLFVLRSASARNVKIGDSAVPTTLDDVSITVPFSDSIFASNYNDGSFVVGVLNDDTAAVGVPHYYVMTQAEWSTFTQNLLSTADWLNISPSEISTELQKALLNPMQYITSAMWIPAPVSTSADQLTSIPMGFWTIPNSTARRWTGTFSSRAFNITLPSHPQSAALEYLNFPPYSHYRLTVEPFGDIDLPGWLEGGATISGIVYIDPSTGDGTLHLSSGQTVIGTFFAKVGVEMQIGQITTDVSTLNKKDVAESGLAAIASTQNFFGVGAVEEVFTGVLSGLTARSMAVQSSGSRGSISAYIAPPRVVGVFKTVSSTNYNAEIGRPLCAVTLLETLSGYTLCATGDIPTRATPAERAEIKNYLTTGFFIE